MLDIIENRPVASDTESKLKFNLQSDGILIIRPQAALRRQDFDKLTAVVDPWIETHHQLKGVLICIDKFPGWENFSGLIHHIEFVKDHHRLVRRVALAVDGLLPEIMSKLAFHFVAAEVKQFPSDEEALALKWLKG